MKKNVSKVVVSFMIAALSLAGCGNSASQTSSGTPQDSEKKTDKIIIRIGHNVAPGSTADTGAIKFKELLEKKTNNAVEVQIFGNSQLGSENDMINLIQMNSLEMLITGDGPINTFIPQYGAITMPYVFRDITHMLKAYNSPEVIDPINKDLISSKGIRIIDSWVRGPRNVTSSKKITKPEDMNGVKLRIPEMKVYVETWKTLGALPTPMALSEVYAALSQHVVDGQENPYDLILTSSFFEVQKYLIKTQHVIGPYLIVISDNFLNGLTDDIKNSVVECAKEAGDYANTETLASQETMEKDLKDKGMEIIEINRDEWVNALKGLPEKLEKQLDWKPGFYKQLVDIK